MLRSMRNHAKKFHWTLWAVIIAFMIGFVATDAFRGDKTSGKSGLIYIDDEPAYQGEDFQRELMQTLDTYKNQFKGNFNKAFISQLQIPEQILERFIKQAVIKAEADKLNIDVTNDEIARKIMTYPIFQQDGKFIGTANYKRLLATNKLDFNVFEKLQKEEVTREKLEDLVAGSIVIDEDTLKKEYKKDKDKAEIDFVVLKPERIKQDIQVSDSEVSDYYNNNKEEFKSEEKRSAYVIAYKFDDYKKEVLIPENDLRDYYTRKKSDFLIPGKTKVSRIFLKYNPQNREEIYKSAEALQKELTRENFAEKAKTFSQDDKAATGGDFGYSDWKEFTPQELAIIDTLQQFGISTVIDTRAGFSILFVPEKVAERTQYFDEIKAQIRDQLTQEKLSQLVLSKMNDIYKKLEKADNIKSKAAENGIKVIETPFLKNGESIKGLDEMGYISRQIFNMKMKEIEFPVQYDKGIAIVQLANTEKPVIEPFEKVKSLAKEKTIVAKKVQLLLTEADSISNDLNKLAEAKPVEVPKTDDKTADAPKTTESKAIEDYLKGKDLKAEQATYKQGNQLSYLPVKKGLDDQIFAMELNRYIPVNLKSDVVLVKIKSRTITTPADFEKDKATFYTQKVKDLKNVYFLAFLNKKLETYKVWINQELVDKIEEYVYSRFQ